MSDTPRTDAVVEGSARLDNLMAHNRMLDHARDLERELAAKADESERWADRHLEKCTYAEGRFQDGLKAARTVCIDELIEEVGPGDAEYNTAIRHCLDALDVAISAAPGGVTLNGPVGVARKRAEIIDPSTEHWMSGEIRRLEAELATVREKCIGEVALGESDLTEWREMEDERTKELQSACAELDKLKSIAVDALVAISYASVKREPGHEDQINAWCGEALREIAALTTVNAPEGGLSVAAVCQTRRGPDSGNCSHGVALDKHCEACGICSDCPGPSEGPSMRCKPCPRRSDVYPPERSA